MTDTTTMSRDEVIEQLCEAIHEGRYERDRIDPASSQEWERICRAAVDQVTALYAENDALKAENERLRNVAKEARRAIGDHHAPSDCYSTGPLTGDPYFDLVQCPACSFITMFDAALATEQGNTND